jgi:hypothetical protein
MRSAFIGRYKYVWTLFGRCGRSEINAAAGRAAPNGATGRVWCGSAANILVGRLTRQRPSPASKSPQQGVDDQIEPGEASHQTDKPTNQSSSNDPVRGGRPIWHERSAYTVPDLYRTERIGVVAVIVVVVLTVLGLFLLPRLLLGAMHA